MAWSAISGISLEASRPECLFGEDVPLFYVLALLRAACLIQPPHGAPAYEPAPHTDYVEAVGGSALSRELRLLFVRCSRGTCE